MTQVRLDGRVIVVTGAGSGLGRSHALALADRGARVVVNDTAITRAGARAADDVVRQIADNGGTAIASYESVTTHAGGQQIVASAVDAFGTVDGVVANAGFVRRGGYDRLTPDDFDQLIDVHLKGSIWVTQAAFGIMKTKGFGRIVLTTSAAGLYGHAIGANYAAAKAGVLGLARALAHEGADHGMCVNAIAPYAHTPMTEGRLPEGLAEQMPPDQVSPVVVYLMSEACTLNNEVLTVGAGTVARVFTATTWGWRAPEGSLVTPEAVRDNVADICDLSRFELPAGVVDELRFITRREDPEPSIGPHREAGPIR